MCVLFPPRFFVLFLHGHRFCYRVFSHAKSRCFTVCLPPCGPLPSRWARQAFLLRFQTVLYTCFPHPFLGLRRISCALFCCPFVSPLQSFVVALFLSSEHRPGGTKQLKQNGFSVCFLTKIIGYGLIKTY